MNTFTIISAHWRRFGFEPNTCRGTTAGGAMVGYVISVSTTDIRGPLDVRISESEIHTSIKNLKRGKSPGTDLVLNEMLKTGKDVLTKPLCILFNNIIENGVYPKKWNCSIITPVFKGGNSSELNNFRGIAVSSCISKLFTKIINARLVEYCEQKKIFSSNQFGFMDSCRTDDNIFVMNTLITSYTKIKKNNLYVCFVDFRKFFDSLNRHHLLYKLQKYGITGKVYNVIKSMYSNCNYCIKKDNALTTSFSSTIGVKQGCNLSPTLSNLYQNDLHEIFDNSCSPVKLGNIEINSMSYADDLLLVSETSKGLQKCMQKLQQYCYKWGLSVNTNKTKYMIFGKKQKDVKLYYSNKELCSTDEYTYLGIKFTKNGSFVKAVEDRLTKANRAIFILKQALSTTRNVNAKLAKNLFQKQIEPIISYGCSNWALPKSNLYAYIENIPNNLDITKVKDNLVTKGVNLITCRRIGRCSNPMRSILIQFGTFEDKMKFLTCNMNDLHKNAMAVNYTIKLDSFNYEKTQNMFCKFALGVNRYSSNHACRAELGQFPLSYKLWTLCTKFWLRLEGGRCNDILLNAYYTCKEEKHEWIENIKYLLFTNGYGNIWYNCTLHSSKDEYINNTSLMFHTRMKDEYCQYYDNKCKESNIYNHISSNSNVYGFEEYLNNVKNPTLRSNICKLRIGNNKLNYYTGTRFNTNTLCNLCDQNVEETVKHVLLYCNNYNNARSAFIHNVEKNTNWDSLEENDKLMLILNVTPLHIQDICTFINKIQQSRKF